jgi:adenylylsulfate kinase
MYPQNPGTGFTLWLTGMQGAGKRTLARELANRLRRIGKPVELLEGADWDVFLGKGPGSTKEERNAIVNRNGFVARVVTRAGGFCIVPQISPYREPREALRREIGRFLEVFVDCPDIQVLMNRDTTGQYLKAMKGEIANFIGITDPYEPPTSPEVRYDSSRQTVDEGAAMVLEALVRESVLTPEDVGLSRQPPKKEKPKGRKPPPPILFTPGSLVLPKVTAPKPDAAANKPFPGKPPAVAAPKPAAAAKPEARKTEQKKPVESGKAAKGKPELVPVKGGKSDQKAPPEKASVKAASGKVAARTARIAAKKKEAPAKKAAPAAKKDKKDKKDKHSKKEKKGKK